MTRAFPAVIIKPVDDLRSRGWASCARSPGIFPGWTAFAKASRSSSAADGLTAHQFLHVDDAAKAFVGVIGKPQCAGQIYNMANPFFTRWKEYHETAMAVLGRTVDMVHVPMQTLATYDIPGFAICPDEFAYTCYFDMQKMQRDVPEFNVEISVAEGMRRVIAHMDEKRQDPRQRQPDLGR